MAIKHYREGHHVNFKHATGKVDIYANMFHDCYELYFLLRGCVTYLNGRERRALRPYELVIIRPGQYHQFIVEEDVEHYERCVINVERGFAEESLLALAFEGKENLLLAPTHRIAADILYLYEAIKRMDESDFAHLLPCLVTDIIYALKYTAVSTAPTPRISAMRSSEVMEYLRTSYAEPLELSMLAARFHLSVSSLCHAFKQDFGISIKQCLLQIRLNAAHHMLSEGESAERAGLACGFGNYSSFYRAYKKQFGISPSETLRSSSL